MVEEGQPRAHLGTGSGREEAMVGKHWDGVSTHAGSCGTGSVVDEY